MPLGPEELNGERQVITDLRESLGADDAPASLLLFGPRSRSDAGAELDLCLVYPAVDAARRARIERLAWEVSFDHGVTLCPLLVDSTEFADPAASPLFARIRREGIPL